MKYLFQVSIGPVQDFIASARRTRDLKFGSELLSELSKAAAKKIAEKCGIESLIFPASANFRILEDRDFNVANKIVALIHLSPVDIGKDIRNAVFKRLHEIRDAAYQEIKGVRELPDSYRKAADAQIDDLVEYFWIALPYEEGHYKDIRENVEALMAARKNTRDFSCVSWGSKQPKSSIDGKLESVIPNDLYPRSWEKPGTQQRKARGLYINFHANVGEHLSGVDLVKRNGLLPTGDSFPSTSHFATIPFLQRLDTMKDKEQAKSAWDTYIQKIREVPARIERMPKNSPSHSIIGNCEGSMLLEERFSDLVDIVDINDDMSIFKDAKKALQEFFQHVDDQFQDASPKVRPGTYYAILLADGDSMGKVIDYEAEKGSERHQQLSQALAKFSESVRSIVEGYHGSLIYAGGDDVLAFIPLHTVLQCSQKLSETFGTTLKNFKDKEGEEGRSPTLSVGVAVIHHLQPLREALELARHAEQKAKKVDWKNALAITISKRSGSDFTIRGPWEGFYNNLSKLIDFCREGVIPEGTAYELRDLSLRLADQTGRSDSATLIEIVKVEAKRILQRKLSFQRSNQILTDNEQEIENKHGQIVEILEAAEKSEHTANTPFIEHFANILIAAQFFADVMELAEPTKGKQQ